MPTRPNLTTYVRQFSGPELEIHTTDPRFQDWLRSAFGDVFCEESSEHGPAIYGQVSYDTFVKGMTKGVVVSKDVVEDGKERRRTKPRKGEQYAPDRAVSCVICEAPTW